MNKISVEAIGALFAGLAGSLGALAALVSALSRRSTEDRKFLRRRLRLLERKFLAAMAHMYVLEEDLSQRPPCTVPERPALLEADDDDDPPAPAGPRHTQSGTGG